MPTVTNKQRLLQQLFHLLGRKGETVDEEPRPVLEQFIYGICREGATAEDADKAFRNLRHRFFDWNEVRVSSIRELEEAFASMPDSELRAQRLVSFLQEVFETTFSFDLEGLHKKGLKQAAKQLSRYQAANDYVGAWVIQQALGGHAIPLDEPTLRTVKRLGLVDDDEDDAETVRASLEHLVPKARGASFVELISTVASEHCWADSPNCAACPLSGECPTGQENVREGVAGGRASRPKSR
jgi:endonuclease III